MMKTTKLFVKILMILAAMSSGAGFAQQSPNEKMVRGYYAAYEKKDWSSMERLLADGFTFSSPVDDHISLKAYKERCWPNCYKIKKFDVVKLIVNGDDAFVTYNGWTTDGKLFRNTEYFKFKDGKIKENECFFGPGVNYPNNEEKKER
jgi:ketosteroid isomerase-like protein